MPYAVEFTPEAEADLDRLADDDPLLATLVLDHIEKLAQSPTELSVPGAVPFRDQQRYSLWETGEHTQ